MASRLSRLKGPAPAVTDRIQQGFQRSAVRSRCNRAGREEQNRSLSEGRTEMTGLCCSPPSNSERISESDISRPRKPRLDSRSRGFQWCHHRAGAAETRSEHQGRICPVRKSSAAPEGRRRAASRSRRARPLDNDLNNLLKLRIFAASSASEFGATARDFLPAHMFSLQSSPARAEDAPTPSSISPIASAIDAKFRASR